MKSILLACILPLSFSFGLSNPTNETNADPIYVKSSATGNNDGSSWRDAFTDLKDALSAAKEFDNEVHIYVAQGTYYPTSGNDRNISFEIPENVTLRGGFKGDELGQYINSDWRTYPTILSGNIGNKNNQIDNSYHVLKATNLNTRISISGFVIRDGYANGSGEDRHGAGIYINSVTDEQYPSGIYSCLLTNNIAASGDGGAIYVENSEVRISYVTFFENESRGDGGALCLRGSLSKATVGNTTFIQNSSREEEGGAIAAFGSSLSVGSTAFIQNSAQQGGAVYTGKNTFLSSGRSTYFKNQSGQGLGSAIRVRRSAIINEDIYWKNESTSSISVDSSLSITYTLSEELFPGEGNISADPLFRNEAELDINLSAGSPAINATKDGISDLGARQYYGELPPKLVILRVKQDAIGFNNGANWLSAYTSLQDALARAKELDTKIEIWVAEGTYFPTSESDRSTSFELTNNVNLIGGFVGNEQEKYERNPDQHLTTLSGNILSSSAGDNSWHVIRADSLFEPAVLDGFTITGGYASGSGSDRHGAGMLLTNSQNLQINNCTFKNNRAPSGDGGAVFAANSRDITFQDCQFISNIAKGDGGAVYIPNSSNHFDFFTSIFEGNESTEEEGGAIATFGRNNHVYSSLFFKNKARSGGAVYNAKLGAIEILHSTLSKNVADAGLGSAVYTRGDFTSSLSIYWNNSGDTPIQSDNPSGVNWEVNFSIVEGGW
ncbi:MAG: right-handed parallel beta-helix repeat-containing protein, partial [Bacteroidota bacterium]